MSSINNDYRNQARKIANQLDKMDGKNGRIESDTWKNYAVKNWGAKDNVRNHISIFQAVISIGSYLKRENKASGQKLNDIAENWYNDLINISNTDRPEVASEDSTNTKSASKTSQITEKKDALSVDNRNNVIAANTDKKQSNHINIEATQDKEKIVESMYAKWSGKFKNSPLDKNFYYKVYDVVKTINCSVRDCDFDSKKYSSKIEQTVDEFIAILAGEAQLNPKAKNGQYRGLFQLATPGLTDLKKWAKSHKDVAGMDKINQNIGINGFWNLSGSEQLNYLVAYIGKAKEYSKISDNAEVTPAQVWAMIKYPFQGKQNSKITAQKTNAINKVFTNSSIERGIQA